MNRLAPGELERIYPAEKRAADSRFLWTAALARLGLLIARPLWRRSASPNLVTAAAIAMGLFGAALTATGARWLVVGGLALVSGWLVLDCADGFVARALSRTSRFGAFVDNMGHHFVYLALWPALGIGLARQSDSTLDWLVGRTVEPLMFVVCGLVVAAFGVAGYLLVYVYQEQFGGQTGEGNGAAEASSQGLIERLAWLRDNLLTLGGVVLPVLSLAAATGWLSLVLPVYAIAAVADLIVRFAYLCRAARRRDLAGEHPVDSNRNPDLGVSRVSTGDPA